MNAVHWSIAYPDYEDVETLAQGFLSGESLWLAFVLQWNTTFPLPCTKAGDVAYRFAKRIQRDGGIEEPYIAANLTDGTRLATAFSWRSSSGRTRTPARRLWNGSYAAPG